MRQFQLSQQISMPWACEYGAEFASVLVTPGPHRGQSSLPSSSPCNSWMYQRGHCGELQILYLGVFLDHKLDRVKNTDALYKKGQMPYFLRRLTSFNICQTMLTMFYETVVASALLFAVVCWGSRLRVADAITFNQLICKASDAVGVELDTLTVVSGFIPFWTMSPTLSMTCWSNRGASSVQD